MNALTDAKATTDAKASATDATIAEQLALFTDNISLGDVPDHNPRHTALGRRHVIDERGERGLTVGVEMRHDRDILAGAEGGLQRDDRHAEHSTRRDDVDVVRGWGQVERAGDLRGLEVDECGLLVDVDVDVLSRNAVDDRDQRVVLRASSGREGEHECS